MTTTSDLNGMTLKDLPGPGANSGKRAVDENGNLIPREFNKTDDDNNDGGNIK